MRKTLWIGLAFLLTAAPSNAQNSPDPYAIFARARHVWMLQQYPRSISYTIEMRGAFGSDTIVRHYAVQYDARTGQAFPNAVSEEQQEHPYVPRGVNVKVQLGPIPVPLNPEHANQDPFGIPALAPNYSFGIAPTVTDRKTDDRDLIAAIRAQFPSGQAPVVADGLPEIGAVTAVHRDYVMELLGEEALNGTSAYHLRLKPVRQPKRYRLRDVWIDTRSFAVERLASDGNFDRGPGTRARWDVDFKTVGGLQFIGAEYAEGALRYADDPFGFTGHLVAGQALIFEDIQSSERGFLETPLVNPDLEILREPD